MLFYFNNWFKNIWLYPIYRFNYSQLPVYVMHYEFYVVFLKEKIKIEYIWDCGKNYFWKYIFIDLTIILTPRIFYVLWVLFCFF